KDPGNLGGSGAGVVLAEGDAPAMARPRKYPDELRERAVRLVFESKRPIAHVARDLGVHREALRQWVGQAEADAGRRRDLLSSEEREELKRLRKKNFRAAQGERDLEGRVRLFRAGARPAPATVTCYVEGGGTPSGLSRFAARLAC